MTPVKMGASGTSLAVQWLGLRASNAGGTGSIPGQGTKILQAACCGQKTNKRKNQTKIKQNKKDGGLFVSRMDIAATMLGHSAVSEVDNRFSLSHSFLYL